MTLLAKNGDFAEREIAAGTRICPAALLRHGLVPGDAGRGGQPLQPPGPALAVSRALPPLLGPGAGDFMDSYKFNIVPATDDRPVFLQLSSSGACCPSCWQLRKRGGAGLVEWGYLVLLATLVQAAVAGAAADPVAAGVSPPRAWPAGTGRRMGSYFFLLGLAFLFVEMAFIQKFILFLSHPLYSVAVVLAGFLVFAGLGSAACPGGLRSASAGTSDGRRAGSPWPALRRSCCSTSGLLPPLFEPLMGLGDAARMC